MAHGLEGVARELHHRVDALEHGRTVDAEAHQQVLDEVHRLRTAAPGRSGDRPQDLTDSKIVHSISFCIGSASEYASWAFQLRTRLFRVDAAYGDILLWTKGQVQ